MIRLPLRFQRLTFLAAVVALVAASTPVPTIGQETDLRREILESQRRLEQIRARQRSPGQPEQAQSQQAIESPVQQGQRVHGRIPRFSARLAIS